jgi:hypothetical protein
MTLDEAIERFEHNAEFERRNGNLQGCLEFRQLVEWLSALQEYKDVLNKIRVEIEQITDTMGVRYNQYVSKIDVLQIIDKYRNEVSE